MRFCVYVFNPFSLSSLFSASAAFFLYAYALCVPFVVTVVQAFSSKCVFYGLFERGTKLLHLRGNREKTKIFFLEKVHAHKHVRQAHYQTIDFISMANTMGELLWRIVRL